LNIYKELNINVEGIKYEIFKQLSNTSVILDEDIRKVLREMGLNLQNKDDLINELNVNPTDSYLKHKDSIIQLLSSFS
jgi:hypothetical protein